MCHPWSCLLQLIRVPVAGSSIVWRVFSACNMHNYCPGAGEGELQLTLMAARYIVYDCVHPATGYAAGEQKATKPLTFMRLLLHFVRQT